MSVHRALEDFTEILRRFDSVQYRFLTPTTDDPYPRPVVSHCIRRSLHHLNLSRRPFSFAVFWKVGISKTGDAFSLGGKRLWTFFLTVFPMMAAVAGLLAYEFVVILAHWQPTNRRCGE